MSKHYSVSQRMRLKRIRGSLFFNAPSVLLTYICELYRIFSTFYQFTVNCGKANSSLSAIAEIFVV